jgi:hypothetical protein
MAASLRPISARNDRLITGIAAIQPVVTKQPQIIRLTDRFARELRQLVCRIVFGIEMVAKQAVDFTGLKTHNLDSKVDLRKQDSELTEFSRQNLSIPPRIGGDLVIRNYERAFFSLTEVG